MRKLALLSVFLALPVMASDTSSSNAIHRTIVTTYGTPVIPGTGNPAGVCPGEVCATGDILAWDDTNQCFDCITNTGGSWTDCAGDAIAAKGPVYIQSTADCSGCSAGAGDLVLSGGDLKFTATQTDSACTADGSDNLARVFAGGGAAQSSRGAYMTIEGNEASNGGSVDIESGTGGLVTIMSNKTANSIVKLIAEAGVIDNQFAVQAGASGRFTGPSDVFYEEGIDLSLDGDVDDANRTVFGAANGLATTTLFRLPPTNGNAGEVVGNTNGTGLTAWVSRPTSLLLSNQSMTCLACPAATTELLDASNSPVTRTKFDTTGYANIRVVTMLSTDTTAADLYIQCDTDSAFGSATDQVHFDNPARNIVQASAFSALSGECVGADVYWRAVTKNGNTAESPVFEKIEVQFK